ncbi:SDR family oxidoreductase [Kutzneria chonburiensis]|uniref:SDR family oxidoreductase n=1 Tax=Kutzneria chonburiensis TaxID=1483604 RepID=A0ABV6N9A8_9PSEU|nr:SDR family oxidoreductase [Kutzneria chonburiensis]
MSTIALVTGANKGVGLATARQLAQLGMTVHLGSRDLSRGTEAAAQLAAQGIVVHPLEIDITDDASVGKAADFLAAEHGRLDVLVNNAGMLNRKAALTVTASDMRPEFETNVFGLVRVIHAMLPLLRRSDAARIVNVSSTSAVFTHTADPSSMFAQSHDSFAYAAGKAAVTMLTLKYANAFRADPALANAKINAVTPGYVATDLNGFQGVRTTEQGARASVRFATLGPDGPSGGFFDEEGPVPW